jgi:hypothetical protein
MKDELERAGFQRHGADPNVKPLPAGGEDLKKAFDAVRRAQAEREELQDQPDPEDAALGLPAPWMPVELLAMERIRRGLNSERLKEWGVPGSMTVQTVKVRRYPFGLVRLPHGTWAVRWPEFGSDYVPLFTLRQVARLMVRTFWDVIDEERRNFEAAFMGNAVGGSAAANIRAGRFIGKSPR